MNDLHDLDLSAWAEEQSSLLHAKNFEKLDIQHLIEELDIVGKSDQHALYSYIVVWLTHRLKLDYQPDLACNSWRASCCNAIGGIRQILKHHPSYMNKIFDIFHDAYKVSRKNSHYETGLPLKLFPENCPYTLNELFSEVNDG